jgi:DNA-binding transcriptional LysR family regulator
VKQNYTIQSGYLDALPVFRAVARFGSFTRAADHLDVSASAVSQCVRALEARLGVRLFNRSSRSVALSEAGQAFLEQVAPSLDQLDLAMQNVQAEQGQPAGLLRINLSRLAAYMLVMPRLPEFVARYPRIQVELFTDDTLADVVGGGFDAGIRFGNTLANDMIAMPIDDGQRRMVVASPDYLHRHGAPQTLADLADHDCIRFKLPGTGRMPPWRFVSEGKDMELSVQGRLIFADDRLARIAARQGLGISQQFEPMVRDDLDNGRLVTMLDSYRYEGPGFFIYYPAREQMPPKLRAFVDFLREPTLDGGQFAPVVHDRLD